MTPKTPLKGRLREEILGDFDWPAGFTAKMSGKLVERLIHERREAADRIEELEEALRWYSSPVHYRYTGWQGDMDPPPALADGGKRAREARGAL